MPRPGVDAFQPVQQARLVPLRLQPAHEPGPAVRQPLVVQVHRVLRRQHHADAERPRLFEQRQQRLFGRRVGDGREVAKDFVHVDQRAQAGRARLRADPADDLVEQQGDKEHALVVVEVGNREDRDARRARSGIEQVADVEGFPRQPGLEAGRGQQVVERHDQPEAVFGRVERFQVQHADGGDGRVLDLMDQRRQVQVLAAAPGVVEHGGEENELAALDGVGFDADQTEQAGDGGVDVLGKQFGVVEHGGFGRGKGLEHRHRDARVAPRRVDADIGGVAQPLDTRAVLAPIGQPLRPFLGLGGRQLRDRQVFADGFFRFDPR